MSAINIPNYLIASTPELLREKMLEKNIVSGMDIRFFDIQFDNKNWVCWFYEVYDLNKVLSKRTNKK